MGLTRRHFLGAATCASVGLTTPGLFFSEAVSAAGLLLSPEALPLTDATGDRIACCLLEGRKY
jgi:hypothetical protein